MYIFSVISQRGMGESNSRSTWFTVVGVWLRFLDRAVLFNTVCRNQLPQTENQDGVVTSARSTVLGYDLSVT